MSGKKTEKEDLKLKTIKPPTILGEAYRWLKKLVADYAKNDLHILLIGETGSGKELFAKHFMAASKRVKEKKTINCASIEDTLLRSEIFGHKKGAYTGATDNRPGILETCQNGILFLDELGDASDQLQASILRVAEGNSYSRLGDDKEITDIDVLIVAATSKPHSIREDLKHRFQVIYVPSLQKLDIPLLAEHFLKKPLGRESLEKLMSREYRGNVRELKRECEKLSLREGKKIFAPKSKSPQPPAWLFDYERFELEITTWNRYLQPIIEKYGLDHRYQYLDKDLKALYRSRGLEESQIKNGICINALFPLLSFQSLTYGEAWTNEPDRRNPIKDDKCMISLINKLRAEDTGSIEAFRTNLNLQFEELELPFLLEALHRFELRDYQEVIRFLAMNPAATCYKPELGPLLDLPLDEAEKLFRKTYFKYLLSKYSNDKRKAADAAGLTDVAFYKRMNRSLKSS